MKDPDLLDKLPKTKKRNLIMYDPTVNSFYQSLAHGEDPLSVIDEMFSYYSKVTVEQQRTIERYLKRYGTIVE